VTHSTGYVASVSTAFRRVGFVLGLAAFRLRRRRGRAALVAAGVAAGAAALAVVLGGRVVAQGESLAQALERVPRADRSVAVTYADLGRPRDGLTLGAVDPLARKTVLELGGREPDRLLQFKLLTIEGTPLVLAGADDVGRWVRLRSGRLPRTCTPARCEVVRLGGGDVPSTAGLALDVVGDGTLRGGSSLGPLPGAAGAQVGETFSPETSPAFVVASGFDELAALPALRSLYRTYAWVTPLDADRVRPWQVDGFTEAVARARSQLRSRSLFLDVGAPTDELGAAGRDARVAGERLLLLGGQAAALVLAFALLAAGGLRTDAEAAAQRLTWFGARRWQLGLLAGLEALVLALAGGIIGWAAGMAVTAILASRAGLPVADVIGHSLVSGGGLVAWLALTAAAALVLVVALRAPAVTLGGRSLGPLDVAGVGALAAAAVVVALGRADADALAAGESGVALLLLPGLVSFAAAVACARLLAPAFAGLARAARAAPVGVRLSVVSLASRPGRAVLAVAFLATCVGLGVFAAVYRSTLAGGVDDQARYAVPADLTVRERLAPGGLVSPLELATLERYRALGAERAVAVRSAGARTSAPSPGSRSPSSRCRRLRSRPSTAGGATSPESRSPRSGAGSPRPRRSASPGPTSPRMRRRSRCRPRAAAATPR
jgi:hypothetical protein